MGLNVNYFAMSATVMGKPVNLVTNKLSLPTEAQLNEFKNDLIAKGKAEVEEELKSTFKITDEQLTKWDWATNWAATTTNDEKLELIKKTLVQKATAAMEFQMEDGEEFDVNAQAIVDFINLLVDKASETTGADFSFPDSIPGFDNLDGLSFRIRDLAFSAVPTFRVKVDVSFSPDFIEKDLGIPKAVTEVITISKFGVGMEYSK